MPIIKDGKLSAREGGAVKAYTAAGSKTRNDWCASYATANFSLCEGWQHNALKVLHKDRVQQAIIRERGLQARRFAINAENILKEHQELYDECRIDKDRVNASRNLESMGKSILLYGEKSINLNVTIPTDPAQALLWHEEQINLLRQGQALEQASRDAPSAICEG